MLSPRTAPDELDECFQRISMTSECYDKIMVPLRRKYYKRIHFRERPSEKLPRKEKIRFDPNRKDHQIIHSGYPFASPLDTQIPLRFPALFPFSPFAPTLPPIPQDIPVINCDQINRNNGNTFGILHETTDLTHGVSDFAEEITIPKPLSFFSHIYQDHFNLNPALLDDDELVRMRGPSRLIGFLVTIAMNNRAARALRWTGNGLEFLLVDRDLVAKMWGNRKHNTKDMDYLKLSRAIREKYEKKDGNGEVVKVGKLKKGSRIYSYVFTEHAHADLEKHTDRSIPEIIAYAARIGEKHNDLEQPPVPDTPSTIDE